MAACDNVFQRTEKKYRISAGQRAQIQNLLSSRLCPSSLPRRSLKCGSTRARFPNAEPLGLFYPSRRRKAVVVLDITFSSIFGAADSLVSSVSTASFLLCCLTSIVLGVLCAAVYMFKHDHSKNFVVTLALLPLIVQMVITLVNGNLGAGIAVMGVFNLVRFRSIPGSAKDIGSVFLAMAIGLATGMGYMALAVVFAVIVAVVNAVFVLTPFGDSREQGKVLRITIPEDLEYEGAFDDILSRYTKSSELVEVQTTNLGSLYQLEYRVSMREGGHEKEMIDELRCLNGNLKISLGVVPRLRESL